MLAILLLTVVLIWALIIAHQINRRGFYILIIWLFIAPITSNLLHQITSEPNSQEQQMSMIEPKAPLKKISPKASTIELQNLLEPTRILFGLFFLNFLLKSLLRKSHLLSFDRTEVYMGVFSILLIANALFLSKSPVFGLRTACDAFIIPFLGYFFARRYITNEKYFCVYTRILGYMSVYVIIISLIERVGQPELLYRLHGPFPTANTLYAVLAIPFFVLLSESSVNQSSLGYDAILPLYSRKFVLYLTPLIIFLTLGRGNWVGFLLGLTVFVFMARILVKLSTKMILLGLLLLFFSAMILAVPLMVPEEFINKRVGNVPNIYARIGAWILVLKEGVKHPILGGGIHNLRQFLGTINSSFWNISIVTTIHNSYLAITFELGIVGLLMYLAVSICLLSRGFNLYRRGATLQDKWRGIAMVCILIAYLVPAMFANTLYIHFPLHHVYLYAYAGAIAALYDRRRFESGLWERESCSNVRGREMVRAPAGMIHTISST